MFVTGVISSTMEASNSDGPTACSAHSVADAVPPLSLVTTLSSERPPDALSSRSDLSRSDWTSSNAGPGSPATHELSADTLVIGALRGVSARVAGDTFVQHLINTLLEATELYVEAQPVVRLDEQRCARVVGALFERSQCALISRTDAARRLGERTQRVELTLPVGELH